MKASRQKRPDWLERNRDEYEELILDPLQNLAKSVKAELAPFASGYHFPVKGIGRLRRPAHRVGEGKGLFKNWLSYSASIPTGSRFDHNPNLFFLINPEDKKDSVLVAGGLYIPSSRQTRSIREAIARDATPFERLFADRAFARQFPGGFSDEHISSRVPRGFDPAHPKIDWIRLQAFFVWRSYTKKQFSSAEFPKLLVQDWKQILRLNELLMQAIAPRGLKPAVTEKSPLSDRLSGLGSTARPMDF